MERNPAVKRRESPGRRGKRSPVSMKIMSSMPGSTNAPKGPLFPSR